MQIIRPIPITDTGGFSRASTATYYNSLGVLSTAAIDEPRFSFNPTDINTGPVFLSEVSRTNLALHSEDFSNALWQKFNSSVLSNIAVAPDGNTTADEWRENSGVSNQKFMRASNATIPTGTYVLSVYLKPLPTVRYFTWETIAGSTTLRSTFDLQNLTVVNFGAAVGSMQVIKDGWMRCSTLMTVTQTANVWMYISNSPSNINAYVGDGTGGFYLWGAQIEAATKISSYIPTSATAVTRAADVHGMMVSNVPETDHAAWNNATRYVAGDRVLDIATHTVYEAANGARGTAVFYSDSTGYIVVTSGGKIYTPALSTQIVFSTTGSLPPTLSPGTVYYVAKYVADGFSISSTPGGSEININEPNNGVHTATVTNNVNIPLTEPKYWLKVGYNNRWSMFDTSVTSQTSKAGSVIVAILPGARFNSIAGLNINARDVFVNVHDPVEGVVYSRKITLTLDSGISNWYAYFFEPIEQATEFLLNDILLSYPNATITISVNSSGTAYIGCLVVGLSKEVGFTEWGAKVGIVDYGIKTRDTFGNLTVVARNFSRRADFTIQVPTNEVDNFYTLLSGYRSVPIVYVGSNANASQKFASTIIYGYYKDFSIDIAYPQFSVCTMQVEGLT